MVAKSFNRIRNEKKLMKKKDNKCLTLLKQVILLVTIGFTVSLFLGCSFIQRVKAPIYEQETLVYHPGKFVWHDLLTSDVGAAIKFYGELFKWTFERNDRYTIIQSNGKRIGGVINIPSKSTEYHVARWISSLSVQDVDKATDFILAEGGKVHKGPEQIEGRGRTALVSDPQGAQLALIRTQNGDPQDNRVGNNSWLWHELWISKPSESSEFYKKLAGYSAIEKIDDYWILKTKNKWRAGIRKLFNEAFEQRWVPVIKVDDVVSIATLAEQLGGKVLIIISGDLKADDKAAVLADPSGGLVIVQEWSGENDPEEAIN